MTRTDSPTADPSVVDMFRALPVRSLVLSVIPAFIALLQGVNVAVNGLPLQYGAPFALMMLTCSAAATRQNLASFRTRTLEDRWMDQRVSR
ncbi:hypothetical protein [Halobacterium zhouii]|uniref:hypothetical protein n=1 Tax=Halobacterium zhouii TaxID=2902624 RepID=UPI001E3AB61A|nr:hypothetical protein [Halobacterium zhouii]